MAIKMTMKRKTETERNIHRETETGKNRDTDTERGKRRQIGSLCTVDSVREH